MDSTHSGYEASAVNHTFGSVGGMLATIKAMVFNRYPSERATAQLVVESKRPHGPLVQLGIESKVKATERETVGAA